MNMIEVINTMSHGNPGAINVVCEMIKDPRMIMDILLLDSLDIRDSHLYMLYNDCCGRKNARFARTLKMFRFGIFTIEEIKANLGQCRAISFIDESIKIEGVPSYDEEFGPLNPKWNEYCQAQKEAFSIKIAPILEQQEKERSL